MAASLQTSGGVSRDFNLGSPADELKPGHSLLNLLFHLLAKFLAGLLFLGASLTQEASVLIADILNLRRRGKAQRDRCDLVNIHDLQPRRGGSSASRKLEVVIGDLV